MAARPSSPWTQTLATLAIFMVGVLLLYSNTAAAMVEIWERSGTFAHCYLVPPISAWLIWRRRADIAAHAPAPLPWLLLPIAAAGLLLLLGDLAIVNALSQLMLVTILVLLVPAFVGWPATRAMLFPLGFLFFAVPIGEYTTPWLMERTADFTVWALLTTGIPVYREGQQFVIPSGTWSVVAACGGVRYLIASLMVGTLFAYLNYRSMRRRWIFVGVSLVVPIIANWLRAYFIVLIGHYSNNTLAVGVDHLIYGWAFFGVVILLMFMIGARYAEPESLLPPAAVTPAATGGVGRMPWAMAAAVALVLAMPMATLHALLAQESQAVPQLGEPVLSAPGWSGIDAPVLWTPTYENPSAQLRRSYVADGAAANSSVGLHVVYFRRQTADRKLVSSNNQIAAPSDEQWSVAGVNDRRLAIEPGVEVIFKAVQLRRPVIYREKAHLLVWQVYWVNGRLTSSDIAAKAYGALYRLLGRGDDAAAVFVYTVETQPGAADALLEGYVRDNLGAIETLLRRTRDVR